MPSWTTSTRPIDDKSLVGVTGPEVEASPIAVDGIERMARELGRLS